MNDLNNLKDDEMYAITMDNARYPECEHCLCRMCMYLLNTCKSCWLCEFAPMTLKCCRRFVPYVFRREPYKSYFRETQELIGAEIDLLDFWG